MGQTRIVFIGLKIPNINPLLEHLLICKAQWMPCDPTLTANTCLFAIVEDLQKTISELRITARRVFNPKSLWKLFCWTERVSLGIMRLICRFGGRRHCPDKISLKNTDKKLLSESKVGID